MKLAARAGFEVPSVQIVDGKYPLFIVERFDRRFDSEGKRTVRVHQQDFCQMQGVPSSRKYERQNGPTLVENCALLRRHSTRKIEDLRALMRWACFNLILGNNDSHSKNTSLLHHAKGGRLAPLYDLISTAIYPEIPGFFAFRIGESNRWEALRSSDFYTMEQQFGVRKGVFLQMMQEICDQLEMLAPAWVEEFGAEFPKVKTARKIGREIQKRIRHFRHQGIAR